MRIQITFPPYDEAEIREVYDDGSVLCDLYGPQHTDTGILFPTGNSVLSLTKKEVKLFREEQTAAIAAQNIHL